MTDSPPSPESTVPPSSVRFEITLDQFNHLAITLYRLGSRHASDTTAAAQEILDTLTPLPSATSSPPAVPASATTTPSHDIEQRLSRLEAWTREEIFARTAMDEPDPDPVTAVSVNPDELIRCILDDQYEHPKNEFQHGYNQALRTAARFITTHINARRAPVAKGDKS